MKKSNRIRLRGLTALFLLCALLLTLFAGCAQTGDPGAASETKNTAAADPTSGSNPTETGTPAETGEGVTSIAVYTLDELTADDPRLDTVIATCGSRSLTNRDFQIYYYMQFFSFMSQYGAYISYFGLDPDSPLSKQPSLQEGYTWEQFFVNAALEQFHQFSVLYEKAVSEGYTLTEEEQANLQEIFDGLPADAESYNYESVDAYIEASFGPGVSEKDYKQFMETYFLASSYENKLYSELNWTDDDLLAYAKEHPDQFGEINTELRNIMVRHILIKTDTAATGEDGETVSAEDTDAAAREKAEEILAEFEKDPTEEHFAALAETYTDDTGSASTGGLYDDVYPGQMVEAFDAWCFDASRQPGDTDIVQTNYGYHVMYFVGQTDHFQWETDEWRENAVYYYESALMSELVDGLMKETPSTVDYASIIVAPMPKDETEADDSESEPVME